MEVTIHYCQTCGFRERADEVARALEQKFELHCKIQKGFWGTFRIEHGGEEVFNRWKTRGILGRIGLGRTPTAAEIVRIFQGRLDCENQPPL